MMGGIDWSQFFGGGNRRGGGFGGLDWTSLVGALGGVLGLGQQKGDPTHQDALNDWKWRFLNDWYNKAGGKDLFEFGGSQIPNFKQAFTGLDTLLQRKPYSGAMNTMNLLTGGEHARSLARGAASGVYGDAASRYGVGPSSLSGGADSIVAKAVSDAIIGGNFDLLNKARGDELQQAQLRMALQQALNQYLAGFGG